MATRQEELRARVCEDHKTFLEEMLDPSWKWNPVLMLPGEACEVHNCPKKAFWVAIGLKFPDEIGVIEREHGTCKANYEVYIEAKQLLSENDALTSLRDYLQLKCTASSITRKRLMKTFANLILKELGISPTIKINDKQRHRLLDYLDMYPERM